MTSDHLPNDSAPSASIRSLKIEEDGDFCHHRIKPKIRLMGRWLEKAGFRPGGRVQVVCLGPGILELRNFTALNPCQSKAVKWEQPDLSLG